MDIMMCSNDKCELKDGCLRFIGIPSEQHQSYILDPEEHCEQRIHKLFVKAK